MSVAPTAGTTGAAEDHGLRLGPLRMRAGVERKHVFTLFFVSFFSIAMMNSVGIMQAYLFNEMLKIPPNQQGVLTGTLLDIEWTLSGEPFLTGHGRLVAAVQQAIREVTGFETDLSTSGGTSDGRFIAPTGCEVVELGPCNATIHKVNECVAIADLEPLAAIYQRVLERLLLERRLLQLRLRRGVSGLLGVLRSDSGRALRSADRRRLRRWSRVHDSRRVRNRSLRRRFEPLRPRDDVRGSDR